MAIYSKVVGPLLPLAAVALAINDTDIDAKENLPQPPRRRSIALRVMLLLLHGVAVDRQRCDVQSFPSMIKHQFSIPLFFSTLFAIISSPARSQTMSLISVRRRSHFFSTLLACALLMGLIFSFRRPRLKSTSSMTAACLHRPTEGERGEELTCQT